MADIANLQFRADTGDIKNANTVLDQLAQTAAKTEKAADNLGKAVSNVGKGGTSGLKVTKQELNSLLDSLNPTSKAFDDLDKAMRQLQSARNQKLIGTEQFADFSSIIDKQRTALQRTYDDLTGYSDRVKAAAAVEKQAAASRAADAASLDRLRAALNPAAEASKKLQEQFTLLNRARLSGSISSNEYTQLRQQLVQLNTVVKESALSAGQLRQGWTTAGYQLKDVFTSLASGINPLTVAAQQLPTLALSFGSLGATLTAFSSLLNPVTIGITALVAGIGYMGYQAYQTSTQMDSLQKSLNGTGNIAGTSARQLRDMAIALADTTKTTQSTAVDAVAAATAIGRTTDQIKQFAEAALVVSKSTGEGVKEVLGQFKQLAGDPVQALVTLNDQYNFANQALYEHVRALSEAGDKTGAMTAIVDALEQSTKRMGETTQNSVGGATGFWDSLADSIGSAWRSLKEYNAENSKGSYDGVGGNFNKGGYDAYGAQAAAKKTAEENKKVKDGVDAILDTLDKQIAKQKEFNRQQIDANSTADKFLKTARTNEQIRADYTKEWARQLKAGLITQEKYNSLVAAVASKYKDPKTPKTPAVKVDQGDKITEQYQAQNLALDAQIQLLQNRTAYEANASAQRKSYLELEAKYTVLEQAATERKLTKQEQQMLAVKDEALSQARILADKGDQLATLQRQAQVQDEISKLQDTQTLQAQVYADNQGKSTKELQRQLELAQARAAVLAKGGSADQANAAVQIKQIDFDQADARASDWISGMKTGLADWADTAQNYAKIAGDAVQSGMKTATTAVSDFVTTGKFDFKDFTKQILSMIVEILTQLLLVQTIKATLGGTSFGASLGFAKGGVFTEPSLHAYANGVYSSPTPFQFGGRSQFAKGGVFGEAGPEAIMPLSRDSNGRLGVKAEGGSGGGVSVQQTVVINSDGSAKTSSSSNDAVGRAVGDQINAAVVNQVAKMMQPGGILFRFVKGG